MVARLIAALRRGASREAAKASGARSLTVRPNPPVLSSMVLSTRAAPNSKISIFFIRYPSFPFLTQDFMVGPGSDILRGGAKHGS
jgi:hypothetical protein